MAVYDNSIGTLILYVYCFLQCLQNWNSLIAQHLEQMVFTNWKHTGQRYYNFCSNACICRLKRFGNMRYLDYQLIYDYFWNFDFIVMHGTIHLLS